MGPHTEKYAWGKFPTPPEAPWLEPLTMLAAMAAVDDTRAARDRASSSRRCARRRCSRSRPRRSTCSRGAGSTSVSAPAGSARSTTPKASTSTQRGQLLTDTLAACKVLWRDTPAAARHADALVPRHLLRTEAGAARRRAAVDRRARCTAQPRSARALRRRVDPDHGRVRRGHRRRRAAASATRGRRPAAIPTGLQVQAPLRIARGDDGRPDLARSMESVPELVAAGATDIHVTLRGVLPDPADAPACWTRARDTRSDAAT